MIRMHCSDFMHAFKEMRLKTSLGRQGQFWGRGAVICCRLADIVMHGVIWKYTGFLNVY